MTLLLVFVGTLFTMFALWRMISPFLGGADVGVRLEHLEHEIREIELLVARREVLLTALRELEFDRETDKIAPDDYARFRARYEREAVAILKRLDEIHGGQAWQSRVDAELTERLGRAPRLSASAERPEPEAEAEAEALTPATAGEETREASPGDQPAHAAAADQCASCGQPLDEGDKFCAQCGAPTAPPEELATEEPAPTEASA